ncbi:MAG: patatin-like phospholipase family protein [Gemmatimonadota bacterium]|nr:patatin-like phospholipase family protein [Gemmatimonadota bacterium]
MTAAGPVTMVCGGGGAKAAAHVGALRALEEAGLVPTQFYGTSMGSVFATLFAGGATSAQALERIAGFGPGVIKPERLAVLKGLWARSLLQAAPFRAALAALIPERRFADLRYPLTVTAVALDTGELILFGAGGTDAPLLDVLYASCALPLFLPPGEVAGRRYADGGLRAVVPLEAAAQAPARLVVAVDVGPGFDEIAQTGPPSGLPPAVDIHNEALGILMAGQTMTARELWRATPGRPPLVYVRPATRRGSTFRVDQVQRYVEQGYIATRAALAGLQSGGG